MTIRNNEPLSMAEVTEYLDKDSEAMKFIKKFTKTTGKEAKEFRKKLESLDLMKMKSEHISKIIDIVPENHEDLNKIFVGTSLDEDESKRIFDTIKEFK
ncbi:hypothetical protein HYT25_01965 [Candidatus Pacearchaeota archaeon]|nr:hypothetical protein [Candidatus Pacearchaeota archaeon]